MSKRKKKEEEEQIERSDERSLIPLITAANIIRSYCKNFEKCSSECPLLNSRGRGCYFNNVTPDQWDVCDLIKDMDISIPRVVKYSTEGELKQNEQ